tara:strand:+ start:184 stop:1923 length:1740 start_codon:yes stop_codon:yes gene_type:complete
MKLKSFKYFFSFIVLFSLADLKSEEKIDIWKKNKNKEKISEVENTEPKESPNLKKILNENNLNTQNIKIEDATANSEEENKVFGLYDPADNDFNLNMWSSTSAEDVRASLKRIKKIKLSKTSNEILENVLLSYSFPPDGMDEKEFTNLKINWLIENNRSDLIENFLKQNDEFHNKGIAVQYLVDENIAQANIQEGCKKIKFIGSSIKDPYLERFKIYCFVLNNNNTQAQLLLDLLREQKKSDKFFDDKINFLLGISDKTTQKINEKNLLNFYLSSITIKNFEYVPSNKTKKEIWKYLNAANLIKVDNPEDREKIKDLEFAANKGQIDEKIIFDIYKKVTFDLNTLINAQNLYQGLENTDARSLIYQKYLLMESIEAKVEYLFLLEELFKKDKLNNVYSKFLSNKLQDIGIENLPEKYQEIAKSKILSKDEIILGKVKYNDKILHQSKILRHYIEQDKNNKKTQKELERVLKKINKNRKYFYSAKDLALVDSLIKDGFKIPNYFNYNDLASKYDVPSNLVQLIQKKQEAFVTLKIVEIIGEDEPNQLDPETIYFITNLLNEMNLIKIRNKVLISALPLRV